MKPWILIIGDKNTDLNLFYFNELDITFFDMGNGLSDAYRFGGANFLAIIVDQNAKRDEQVITYLSTRIRCINKPGLEMLRQEVNSGKQSNLIDHRFKYEQEKEELLKAVDEIGYPGGPFKQSGGI